MSPEQLYLKIKDLADKLGITVSEQNFKATGIHVESGFCKIRNQKFLIIDKHKPIVDKLQIVSSVIAAKDLENIYVMPAVRQHLESVRPKTSNTETDFKQSTRPKE